MRQKNDMVFPVSLSEIAFTLVFMLMLLLGFMILNERKENEAAKARIAQLEQSQFSTQATAAATSALTQAEQALATKMAQAGAGSPEQVAQAIKEFANVGESKVRQEQLQDQVLDLTQKLVVLEDLRKKVEQAGRKVDEKLAREEIEQAIALRDDITKFVAIDSPSPNAPSAPATAASGSASSPASKPVGKTAAQPTATPPKPLDKQKAIEQIRQAIAVTRELREQAKSKLGIDVLPGQETKLVRDVVEGAHRAAVAASNKASPESLKQENATLRTQVAFYDKRDKLRGLDHPPCWMDSDSKIEYIFNVQTTQAGYIVTRGWPAHRETQARASAGFSELMDAGGTPLSAAQFAGGAKPFLDFGKAQSPECRHFVYLSSTIADADRRDEARRMVNSFFYVLERKAPIVP